MIPFWEDRLADGSDPTSSSQEVLRLVAGGVGLLVLSRLSMELVPSCVGELVVQGEGCPRDRPEEREVVGDEWG